MTRHRDSTHARKIGNRKHNRNYNRRKVASVSFSVVHVIVGGADQSHRCATVTLRGTRVISRSRNRFTRCRIVPYRNDLIALSSIASDPIVNLSFATIGTSSTVAVVPTSTLMLRSTDRDDERRIVVVSGASSKDASGWPKIPCLKNRTSGKSGSGAGGPHTGPPQCPHSVLSSTRSSVSSSPLSPCPTPMPFLVTSGSVRWVMTRIVP